MNWLNLKTDMDCTRVLAVIVTARHMLEAIEHLARVVTLPLSAMPNAGLPRDVEGRKMYMASPEYMAEYAKRFNAGPGWLFLTGKKSVLSYLLKPILKMKQNALRER